MWEEWYNKCIAARRDYFEGDKSFMCVLSIKGPIRKKSGNLFNDPRIYNSFKSLIILLVVDLLLMYCASGRNSLVENHPSPNLQLV